MSLKPELFTEILGFDEDKAWARLVSSVLEITSNPLNVQTAVADVARREREIAELDHLLAGAAWDLWRSFHSSVERTSQTVLSWWEAQQGGRAVLLLDGLSLRELPWLLQGAAERGLTLHGAQACASEIPGETTPFARALGLQARSQLQNHGAGATHLLKGAVTETADLAWSDCQTLIDSSPDWLFWHHWPDCKLHEESSAGYGLESFTREVSEQLRSEEFWSFVSRLATGRRLVIASDHGYAASGGFPDASGELGQFLKSTFGGGRSTVGDREVGPYVPPVALRLEGLRSPHLLALGRRKWKNQGGYPTLTHGGLTLLEVLCPVVELSK